VPLPEPLLEVVGHGRDRGGAGFRDGGRAGELGPEPGLNFEIGAGQVQKAAPLGHAAMVGSASRKQPKTGKGKRGIPVSPFELLRGVKSGKKPQASPAANAAA